MKKTRNDIMHHDQNMPKQHSQHHGNGFMLGLLLGAGIATTLSTKKGRTIVKDMAVMVLEHLDNFLEEEAVGTLQEETVAPPVVAPQAQIAQTVVAEEVAKDVTPEPVVELASKPKKKFFRGLRKSK